MKSLGIFVTYQEMYCSSMLYPSGTAHPYDCARTKRWCWRKDVCCFGHQTRCVDILSFHFCHASEQMRFVCHEVVCCFVGGTTRYVPKPDGAEARMRRNASCQRRRLDQSTLNSVGAVCHVSEIPTSKSRPWHSSFWDALHRQTGDQSIFRDPHRNSNRHKLLQRLRDADGFSNRVSRWWQAMSLKARCIPPRLMQVPIAGTHGEKEIGIAQTLDSVYEQSM